jgi:hypothetical protein
LGRQPRQDVKLPRPFRDWIRPHLRNATDGLVKPKLMNRCPTVWSVDLVLVRARVGIRAPPGSRHEKL